MFAYIIKKKRPSKTIANITHFLIFIPLIIKETRALQRNISCLIFIFGILFITCGTENKSTTKVGLLHKNIGSRAWTD